MPYYDITVKHNYTSYNVSNTHITCKRLHVSLVNDTYIIHVHVMLCRYKQ